VLWLGLRCSTGPGDRPRRWCAASWLPGVRIEKMSFDTERGCSIEVGERMY